MTPQVSSSAIFSVSEVTRDIIHPSGVLPAVRQRELLQVIKKIFAQVVAHAFTLQADQVDKEEYAHRLYQHNRSRNGEQAQNGGFVLKYDAFINNKRLRIVK